MEEASIAHSRDSDNQTPRVYTTTSSQSNTPNTLLRGGGGIALPTELAMEFLVSGVPPACCEEFINARQEVLYMC